MSRRLQFLSRSYFPRSAILVLIFLSFACGERKTQLYDPGEANIVLLGAFAAKDFHCSTTTAFSLPIFIEADRNDVDLCASMILAQTCAAWSGTDPVPDACKAIIVSL